MKQLLLSTTIALASASAAFSWSGETNNGIHFATMIMDEMNEISLICDAGFNAPITSINFVIDGVVPEPNSIVFLQFDQKSPIYVKTDVEGAIGSNSASEAKFFNQVVAGLKGATNVKVRLYEGSSQVFSLRGSTDAIGDCSADFDRFQLALN